MRAMSGVFRAIVIASTWAGVGGAPRASAARRDSGSCLSSRPGATGAWPASTRESWRTGNERAVTARA